MLSGRAESHQSISMTREILTLTLCQSTWPRPAIRRHCSPHTSTASPLLWIMEHTPSAGARETWFEECEGHYQDCLFRGGAKRLLGRTWVFPLRRNLTPLHTQLQSTDPCNRGTMHILNCGFDCGLGFLG